MTKLVIAFCFLLRRQKQGKTDHPPRKEYEVVKNENRISFLRGTLILETKGFSKNKNSKALFSIYINYPINGTVLQIGRSLVRSQLVSVDFSLA